METKIRVSCVSYLNSKPFVYGLTHHPIKNQIQLSTDNPAECALKLIRNTADVGLVPVAAIPQIENAQIISDFCIGANDNVASVLLLSESPLQDITHVLLDYQSLTSVNLVKILASEYWKISPVFENARPGFENEISGTRAAVVIGDRALELHNKFKYTFDLAGEWKKFSGLPFVFACWVSNKSLQPSFVTLFNDALKLGLEKIDTVINDYKQNNGDFNEIEFYLKKQLSFSFDEPKKKALALYLNYIKKLFPVAEKS